MPKKVTVYMVDDDLVRFKILQRQLQAEYPFQRVNQSWLFRYCVYKVLKGRGLANEKESHKAGVGDYGNREVVS